METYAVKEDEIKKEWYVVDAAGQVLGRLASRIASVLAGKHKAIYSPHIDVGDFVIVVNAEKVVLTGRKKDQKFYYRHSGYPGGLKAITVRKMLEEHPEKVIEHAVRGMLPRNKLRDVRLNKLKVYVGPEHPHVAQKPKKLES